MHQAALHELSRTNAPLHAQQWRRRRRARAAAAPWLQAVHRGCHAQAAEL